MLNDFSQQVMEQVFGGDRRYGRVETAIAMVGMVSGGLKERNMF